MRPSGEQLIAPDQAFNSATYSPRASDNEHIEVAFLCEDDEDELGEEPAEELGEEPAAEPEADDEIGEEEP